MEKIYTVNGAAISYFKIIFYRPVCQLLKMEGHSSYFEFAGLTRADLLVTIINPLFWLFKIDMARRVFGFMGLTLANLLALLLPRLTHSLAVF